MPNQIDLEPTKYKVKRRITYRLVPHASPRQLWAATALGVWAASVWALRFTFDFMPSPFITMLIAFGPGVAWYLYLAFTDE